MTSMAGVADRLLSVSGKTRPRGFRGLLRAADRALLHPWTSRLGAVQALLGGALTLAALVGGLVVVFFAFPTVLVVLTMAGTFLLGLSVAADVRDGIRRRRLERWVDIPELQRIAALVGEELEAHGQLLANVTPADVWWERDRILIADRWNEHGAELARFGFHDAHQACREAYRELNDLNWLHRSAWAAQADELDQLGPIALPTMTKNERTIAERCINVIEGALDALAELPESYHAPRRIQATGLLGRQ